MSTILSAAENVARQRQNVRRDLKKDGGRKQSGLAGVGVIICLSLLCAVQEKCFNYSGTIIFIFLVPL